MLKMHERFNVNQLSEGHFELLEKIERDYVKDLERARGIKSLAVNCYNLAVCHREDYRIKKEMLETGCAYPQLCEAHVKVRTIKDFCEFVYTDYSNPWKT